MDYTQLMQRAQVVQTHLTALQEKIKTFEVTGTSGANLLNVILSGIGSITKIDIDISLLVPEEKTVLEDLIIAAFNDARQKMEKLTSEEMTRMRHEYQLFSESNFLDL